MIKKQNKRIEVTLSSEELELLNSICLRFNISKSRAISQALKVFAAKRKHIITLSYKEADEKKSHDKEIEDFKEQFKKDGEIPESNTEVNDEELNITSKQENEVDEDFIPF